MILQYAMQPAAQSHLDARQGDGAKQEGGDASEHAARSIGKERSDLAKNAEDEEPDATGHPSHAGGTQGEGYDSIVLGKHVDGRGGGTGG